MTDVNGLGSFSSITSLKEIAENKDMPVLLKVSMFLNQLGIEKQAEAKTLIKDLDDTRNKATEYSNILNRLNEKKDYCFIRHETDIGILLYPDDHQKELEATDKMVANLKELEEIYSGTITAKGKTKEEQDNYIKKLKDDAFDYAVSIGFNKEDAQYAIYEFNNPDGYKRWREIFEIRKDVLTLGPEIYGKNFPQILNEDNIDSFMDSIKNKRETLMSTVQEKMVVIQDVMGQYNTFVQGSSSTLGKYADMAKSLSRNML